MSVRKAVMVVMRMPTVPILKEATTVPASLATLEMEEYAQVYFTTCLANQRKFTQFQSFFVQVSVNCSIIYQQNYTNTLIFIYLCLSIIQISMNVTWIWTCVPVRRWLNATTLWAAFPAAAETGTLETVSTVLVRMLTAIISILCSGE